MKENKQPLVSIVIPVYNVEKYLERCLNSVVNQSYSNIDIILINDGSIDKSTDICKRWAAKEPRIKFINLKENGGSLRARVKGMKAMRGNFFTFIDADDYVQTDYIEKLVDCARRTHADMTMIDGYTIVKNNNLKDRYKFSDLIRSPRVFDGLMRGMSEKKNGWGVAGKLYKNSIYQRSSAFLDGVDTHISMGDDIVYSLPFCFFARTVCRIAGNYSYFYFSSNSHSLTKTLTHSASVKKLLDIFMVTLEMERFLIQIGLYDKYKHHVSKFRTWQVDEHINLIRSEYLNNIKAKDAEINNLKFEIEQKNSQLMQLTSIKESARQLAKNVKRRLTGKKPTIDG